MMRNIRAILALAALHGFVAFALAAKLVPKADIDLGPVDYQCPEGVYIAPHETQCELYYICASGGTPTHLYHCFSEYLFDINFNGCNFKELVDCDHIELFPCPSPNGNFPISTTKCDSRYYACVNDIPTLEQCPNGEIFDASTGSCGTFGTVVCTTTTPTRTTTAPGPFMCPEPNGQFPSPYSCTQYYVCNENAPILKDCPSGLYYNPVIQQCDWPSNVPSCTAGRN